MIVSCSAVASVYGAVCDVVLNAICNAVPCSTAWLPLRVASRVVSIVASTQQRGIQLSTVAGGTSPSAPVFGQDLGSTAVCINCIIYNQSSGWVHSLQLRRSIWRIVLGWPESASDVLSRRVVTSCFSVQLDLVSMCTVALL